MMTAVRISHIGILRNRDFVQRYAFPDSADILRCFVSQEHGTGLVDEYKNPGLIGNARSDSVLYDLPPAPTGKRGRPATHGKRLSIEKDFTLSDENTYGLLRTLCSRNPAKHSKSQNL